MAGKIQALRPMAATHATPSPKSDVRGSIVRTVCLSFIVFHHKLHVAPDDECGGGYRNEVKCEHHQIEIEDACKNDSNAVKEREATQDQRSEPHKGSTRTRRTGLNECSENKRSGRNKGPWTLEHEKRPNNTSAAMATPRARLGMISVVSDMTHRVYRPEPTVRSFRLVLVTERITQAGS